MRKKTIVFIVIILTSMICFTAMRHRWIDTPWEMTSRKQNVMANDRYDKNKDDKHKDRQIIISLGKNPNSAVISWKGKKDGPGYLRINRDREQLPQSPPIKAKRRNALNGSYYRYFAEVDVPKVGKTYYYEIGDGINFDYPRTFEAPEEHSENTFLYMGDVQFDVSVTEYNSWGDFTEDIYKRHPGIDCAIIGGDMVNVPGEKEQWNGFLENCNVFEKVPLMTVSGNHEGVKSNYTYRKLFTAPNNGPEAAELKGDFYYFDYGSCRFIMTDSSFLTKERKKRMGVKKWIRCEAAVEKWLDNVTEKSPKQWNIVVTHHPPYGMHDRDTVSPELRRKWAPIMEKNSVDLVLCGHQHMYMRTEKINGITYIMGNSGDRRSNVYNGQNAPDYCVKAYGAANYQLIESDVKSLSVTSYNKKGLMIDEAVLTKDLNSHIFKFLGGN